MNKKYQSMLCALALATSLITLDSTIAFAENAPAANADASAASIATENTESGFEQFLGKPVTAIIIEGTDKVAAEDIMAAVK